MQEVHTGNFDRASRSGFLIALGIVYGDIGTSPLYTMQSLVENQGGLGQVTESFILGSISLIIWTLTLMTTIKYVWIALKADNHHEGGIFALYTLVRKMAKWLMIPAMIGGATLLSDGALTPAVTVTTAIEGLKAVPSLSSIYSHQHYVILTTLLVLAVLFGIQRYGTGLVGRIFGPVMIVWFSFLGLSGLFNSLTYLAVFKAINPYYALQLLMSPENHRGIFILGSIFLATTGAEALYSDFGHVGRGNIYVSWPFVKLCIILSYCGQGAWVLHHQGSSSHLNPFFASLPTNLVVYAVLLATLAAIIASQALISGSFSLVSEAMRLKFFPLFKMNYPGQNMGQLYIPAINWLLFAVTSAIVLLFQTSERMEAAYGLAITITMLMTTILLTFYLIQVGVKTGLAALLMAFFALIEGIFFSASLVKFMHGDYVAVFLAMAILFVMFIWYEGNQIVFRYIKSLNIQEYKAQLNRLRKDDRYEQQQANLVYLTNRMKGSKIDRSILYSILNRQPKRAQVYWFVNVKVTDEPYAARYKVDTMGTDFLVRVELYLDFKMPQTVPRYMRTIIRDMIADGLLPKQIQEYGLYPQKEIGNFRYIILDEKISNLSQMSPFERFVMQTKAAIKHVTASPTRWFGLQFSETQIETIPLSFTELPDLPIQAMNCE